MARSDKPFKARKQWDVLPLHLLQMVEEGAVKQPELVAVDTETSGLFVDDGARVATVSVAWFDEDHSWSLALGGVGQHQWGGGIVTVGDEPTYPGTIRRVVSMAWPFDQGVAGTGKKEDNGQETLWPEAENQSRQQWVALLAFLAKSDHVYHHAKFDLHMFNIGTRVFPGIGVDFEPRAVYDTQNGCALLFPGYPTSLKTTSARLWGTDVASEQQVVKNYLKKHKLPAGRWDLMPWGIIAKYADQDARLTICLADYQLIGIDVGELGTWLTGENGKMSVEQALMRRLATSKMLYRVENRGLPFDTEGALKASEMANERARVIEDGLPFSPATLPAAKKYWFGKEGEDEGTLGLQPYEQTPTGQAQVNAFIVDKMVKDNIPAAAEWRELQKVRTADERWYKGYADLVGSDGRLRGSVRQNGTVSGRFSIERVQLQAIPHDYRLEGYLVLDGIPTPRQLIASGVPEGLALWELDLANAELRVAALMAGCQTMLDMIDEGVDLHGFTTKELFGVDETDPAWGRYRNIGKRGNFSFIFGVGWETFQHDTEVQTGIHLTEKQAREIVVKWNRLYPEFNKEIRRHSGIVERRRAKSKDGLGWIELANGERRWFGKDRFGKPEETHKAFNQRVQPSLAQFGIDWWLASEKEMRKRYGDQDWTLGGNWVGRLGLVMMIHDSAVLLVPNTKEGEKSVMRVKQLGEALWKQRFPGVPGGVDAKRWSSD